MASLTRAVTRLAIAGRQAVRTIATTTPVSGHGDDIMEKWPADSEFFFLSRSIWYFPKNRQYEKIAKQILRAKHHILKNAFKSSIFWF